MSSLASVFRIILGCTVVFFVQVASLQHYLYIQELASSSRFSSRRGANPQYC